MNEDIKTLLHNFHDMTPENRTLFLQVVDCLDVFGDDFREDIRQALSSPDTDMTEKIKEWCRALDYLKSTLE